MASGRAAKVAEAIKEEVSDILANKMKDPRLGFVSVVKVEVSRDLRHAKVGVSVLGDVDAKRNTLQALEQAVGFIRSELGRRLRLRHVPELKFRLDESIEEGVRIARLLEEMRGKKAEETDG